MQHKDVAQHSAHPIGGVAVFSSSFLASSFSCFQTDSTPTRWSGNANRWKVVFQILKENHIISSSVIAFSTLSDKGIL